MALRERVEATRAPGPDGRAAVCKTAGAGSTPAGASHRLPRRPPPAIHPHRPKTSTWPAPRLLWRAIGCSASTRLVVRRDGLLPPKAENLGRAVLGVRHAPASVRMPMPVRPRVGFGPAYPATA